MNKQTKKTVIKLINTCNKGRKLDRKMQRHGITEGVAREWWKIQRKAAILEAIIGLDS